MAVSSTAVSTWREYCWASCKIIVDHDDDYGDSDGDADDSDCLLHGRVHLENILTSGKKCVGHDDGVVEDGEDGGDD